MASVSRAGAGVQNKNPLRFHRVKIYIQRFPGKIGEDKDRGVTGKPKYAVSVAGNTVQSGNLEEDGSIEVFIPGGARDISLKALGTVYDLKLLLGIEKHDSLLGQQRRLKLLGYYESSVDDKYGARTDAAALDFQADNGLTPDGKLSDPTTYDKLKDVFGE